MSEDVVVFTREKHFHLTTLTGFINEEPDGVIADEAGHIYRLMTFTFNDYDEGFLREYWYAAEEPEKMDASDLYLAITQLNPKPVTVKKP
ncbi:hypothetical protein [Nissabacter sp. SGAir0207]|uniref:hypothetical protein n=1 Tax=Nissabacter sp. SGAir0207 TaxID=2126321 RepID=UPI0010F77CFA|nr:hypothetical protein [Nissabacter sp. SGAir0207]